MELGVHFLEGLGGRLQVQHLEHGRPVGLVELLDDIGKVRRMEFLELADRDVELQVLLWVAGQGLDVLPGDQLFREAESEEPVRQAVDRLEPAEPPEDAADAEVDVDDPEVPVDDEEMDVVDALDLGTEGVDDLLVQDVLSKENLLVPDTKAG